MAERAATGGTRAALLVELLRAGLERVDGRRCVRAALAAVPPGRFAAAAIGKAALAMALGAQEALGGALERLLVVCPHNQPGETLGDRPGVEIHKSAHPVPDEHSLRAGARLLSWLEALPPAVTPLFLISGGASALVEVPIAGVTLDQLVRVVRRGLAEGQDIATLNAARAALSQIKGGQLAARLGGRSALALFISDVPGDDPALIGSGLVGPAPGGDSIRRMIVASIDMAMDAVVEAAQARGLTARRARERFAADAARLAVQFTHELALGEAQIRVWGGESTLRLPAAPGRGGRNQHLALAAARLLAGYPDLALLAAGTDGIDGPTAEAGAVVDGDTCGRIALNGLDCDESLRRADAGTALAAAGALLRTGPTGTNVADLVIGAKLPARLAAS